MGERFEEQSKEILEICARLGIEPDELGQRAGIQAETMRKYAKGYQKASDMVMQGLRNVQKIHSLLNEGAPSPKKTDSSSPHGYIEIATLEKALADLCLRLPKSPIHERKYILSNIRDMLDELDQRELLEKPANSKIQEAAANLVEGVTQEILARRKTRS